MWYVQRFLRLHSLEPTPARRRGGVLQSICRSAAVVFERTADGLYGNAQASVECARCRGAAQAAATGFCLPPVGARARNSTLGLAPIYNFRAVGHLKELAPMPRGRTECGRVASASC